MERLIENTVLLIIDVQDGFDLPRWGVRNNPHAEENIGRLLKAWRENSRPIVHVQHNSVEADSPLRPDHAGNKFKDNVMPLPGEHIEGKTVNSAFIGTGLEQYLRNHNFNTLVVVGLTTDHCVSTTTRMAGNLGFETYVVADATATFNRSGFDGKQIGAQDVHDCALASLHTEFATVVNTNDVLEAARSIDPVTHSKR